jgi:hypothetical protein
VFFPKRCYPPTRLHGVRPRRDREAGLGLHFATHWPCDVSVWAADEKAPVSVALQRDGPGSQSELGGCPN